jgi:uncharacterized protein with FMN-binding domain
MKFLNILFGVGIVLLVFSFSAGDEPVQLQQSVNDMLEYHDGIYCGQSRANYTSEPFWGHIKITVESHLMSDIEFYIRDSSLHECVDSLYGVRHYASIPEYMQQCVNEDHAIKIYPQQLLLTQNVDEIDAISGATWTYNIFVASTKKALTDAVITSSGQNTTGNSTGGFVDCKPNPFRSAVIMEYELTSCCRVNLSIYDCLGRLTRSLVDEAQAEGMHRVIWNDCPSEGIYYCMLQMGEMTVCRQIIHIN